MVGGDDGKNANLSFFSLAGSSFSCVWCPIEKICRESYLGCPEHVTGCPSVMTAGRDSNSVLIGGLAAAAGVLLLLLIGGMVFLYGYRHPTSFPGQYILRARMSGYKMMNRDQEQRGGEDTVSVTTETVVL